MKVFLRYSPRGDRDAALSIYRAIQDLGHVHTSDFVERVSPTTFYNKSDEEWTKQYALALAELDAADVCVFETSTPSISMGRLAQLSVEKFKPTILLYKNGVRPYAFQGLAGTERRVQLLEYTQATLSEVLTYAFTFAHEFIHTRFTLLFPPDIMTHLGKIKKSGKSQSEYIRDLIRKDMEA